ncbi:unnamed protein product, partial [Orchesella dallaii]
MFCIIEVEDEGGKSVEVVPQNWLGLPDQELEKSWRPREVTGKTSVALRKHLLHYQSMLSICFPCQCHQLSVLATVIKLFS